MPSKLKRKTLENLTFKHVALFFSWLTKINYDLSHKTKFYPEQQLHTSRNLATVVSTTMSGR